MSSSTRSDNFFKNRRKTREALLCVLYAYEMNASSIEQIQNDPESFFDMLEEGREIFWPDILRDQLETVFEDVRQHKLEPEDQIQLEIPRINETFTINFAELESNYWQDGFAAYCRQASVKFGEGEPVSVPDKELDAEAVAGNREFFRRSLELYRDNAEKLDQLITEKLQNWDFSRIAVLDKVIIRMGILELLNYQEIPPLVAVNEAIELGKKFSTDNSGKFINGLLHAFLSESDRQSGSVAKQE